MKAEQRYTKAKELRETGCLQGAISEFQECLKQDTNNVIYLFELGEIYDEVGERDEAKKCFFKIEAIEPYSMYAKAAAERLDKLNDDERTAS